MDDVVKLSSSRICLSEIYCAGNIRSGSFESSFISLRVKIGLVTPSLFSKV